MSERKIFFQDFLFEEMPVDEQDYPIVDIKMISSDVDIAAFTVVSFDTMLRMNKLEEWELLFQQLADKSVCIVDDVPLDNLEMEPYKHFYLCTYFFCLSRICNAVYIQKGGICKNESF